MKIIAKESLKITLAENGLSQRMLSEQIDKSPIQIHNIVTGKSGTSSKTAKTIADLLGHKVSDLFDIS